MHVRTSKLGVATYLAPDAALIKENLPALEESVSEVGTSGFSNLVIDLRRVPFFDSAGLEYLLDLSRKLRESGGSLRLANANTICKDTLHATQLDKTIRLYDELESAGKSFL